MAAPTTVRVESTSTTETRVYWVANGSANVGIYRSTDGSAYSLVGTNAVSNSPFYDSGLATGTRYWYKLSDDVGVSFSAVVTVVTHTCPADQGALSGIPPSLPRIEDFRSYEELYKINIAFEDIEAILGRELRPGECFICATNGAIVLDCMDGCRDFVVYAAADINSISINNCADGGETGIEFVIPPGSTVGICGWPAGVGFSGDECNDAPITGGAAGRSIGTPIGPRGIKPPKGGSTPGHGGLSDGGSGGGLGCSCVPGSGNALTIECCTTSCSMSCGTSRRLDLKACGGVPPYSWTKTKGTLLGSVGDSVVLLSGTSSSVAGNAYKTLLRDDLVCASQGGGNYTRDTYDCNDILVLSQAISWSSPCCEGVVMNGTAIISCEGPVCNPACGSPCVSMCAGSQTAELRDAAMIAAGCSPCGANIGGVVTVTDSLGTSVSKTLTR